MRCFLCLDTGLSRVRSHLREVAAIEFDPVTFAPQFDLHLYLNPECPVT